jgi:hypothetical protein
VLVDILAQLFLILIMAMQNPVDSFDVVLIALLAFAHSVL